MAVLAYHAVFSAYGHWLPNDPRGSGSSYVGAEHLRRFGPATRLDDRRRSVAHRPHDAALRRAAKRSLQRPAVQFTGLQARAIGRGFGDYVLRAKLTVWACSILPNHVHLVVARHRLWIEQIVLLLKSAASEQLLVEGLHPFGHLTARISRVPTCWGGREWKVFLNTEEEILERIRYVEQNPIQEGLPPQRWPFAVPYPKRYSP
jgi:REP element-mobilizing transposase RayT